MSVAGFLPESPLELGFVRNAEAIIGMPWTPVSVAGVARRSMYREAVWNAAAVNAAAANAAAANMAAANAAAAQAAAANAVAAAANAQRAAAALPMGTMVPSLPPGCTSTVITGVNYFNCGGVYYGLVFREQHRLYSVSSLRARSRLLKKPHMLRCARPIVRQRTRRVRLCSSVFVRLASESF
jgi:hypothetical protein